MPSIQEAVDIAVVVVTTSFSLLLYLTNLKSCLNLEPMADDSKLKISGKTEKEIEILTSVELGNFEQFCSNHT